MGYSYPPHVGDFDNLGKFLIQNFKLMFDLAFQTSIDYMNSIAVR